ncbi:glycosyltransferase [Geotalea uraniireducens]|uniref:Glycosyl transferase, family 2 n=1 Tax=Geotalea uraniireducens (strain Rf4) TaxID=351605 RepID=A5G837_GEOUR|nr:glycosyltransferase [Geotalea uraniireducens]ABQ27955.1 glycosyl transferase, family 2 [Geotalea uraniireducens Rf4]
MGNIRYSISIVVLNNLDITKKCLQLIEANSGPDYELIISDNGSVDGTAEFLRDYSLCHANCKIISYAYNTGFGHPHNQALLEARGEYFVVLNNDIFIHESGWLEKLSRCFDENARLAIVGFTGGYSALDDIGHGVKEPARGEYIQASCLMIPRRMADSFGLFAEEYELAYWEDVDLSLRYRQMGFDIQLVSCLHEHIDNATSATIDKVLLSRVRARNHKTFQKRWSGYLEKRSFTGRVLICAVTDSLDSLLAVTTVLQRLKDEQLLVNFDLITNHPEVFLLHPAVDACFLPNEVPDHEGYDRIIDLDFSSIPPGQPVVLALAEQAVVTITRLFPVLHLDSLKQTIATPFLVPGKEYAVLTVSCEDEHFEQIKALVAEAGYEPVIVEVLDDGAAYSIDNGERVDFRAMAAAVSTSRLLIGPSGVPLKVAQALGVPVIAIFRQGEDPLALGIDFARASWIFARSDLPRQLEDVLNEEGDRAEAELAYLQKSILQRMADYNALWLGYRGQTERIEQIAQEYAELENQFRCKSLEYDEIIARQEQVIAEYDHKISALENSLIWRVTSPIRRMIDFMLNQFRGNSCG